MTKQCTRCTRPALKGFRFCLMCKDDVRYQLDKSGYLTQTAPMHVRAGGCRENTLETRKGTNP